MKNRLLCASYCFIVGTSLLAQTSPPSPIPGVFSTGVGDDRVPLAAGTVDPHWTLTSSPVGAKPATVTSRYPMWVPGTSTAAWINDSGSSFDSPVGDYVYTIRFSLLGFDPGTATITGDWYSDNSSTIYLNGVNTGIIHGGSPWEFTSLDSFTLKNGFVSGQNTLSFLVQNLAAAVPNNPSGLQVRIKSATASVIPEPTSLSLLCLLGGSLVWRHNRKSGAARQG